MKSPRTSLGILVALAFALLLTVALASQQASAGNSLLDASFSGGLVTTNFLDTDDSAFDVALQSDGKIVAAGTVQLSGTNYDFALARYNADGSPDNSFSGNGNISTGLSDGSDVALAVTIQPDGNILMVGYCTTSQGSFNALVRYLPNAALDFSFGNGGKVCGNFPTLLSDVAVQSDGKIVATGYISTPGQGFGVYRYNANGTVDTTFGNQGRVLANFAGNVNEAYALALQPDGKIVVAGTAQLSGVDYDLAAIRLNPDGTFDNSFGANGALLLNLENGDDAGHAIALSPDGKIYMAGALFSNSTGYNFAVVRFNQNGTLDVNFSSDGVLVVPMTNDNAQDVALDIVLQADGKVVAAGYATDNGILRFALIRAFSDGTLDPTFNGTGRLLHSFNSGEPSQARSLVIQPDGKTISAGSSFMVDSGNTDFALARYLTNDLVIPTSTIIPSVTPTANPSATPTVCTISFTDVPQGSTFYDFVTCIYCQGIIGGYDTGCETGNPCFRPNNNLTRGQLAKIVSNAAAFSENFSTNTFEDVVVGSTFHLFVERLASRSIIGGYACGGAGEPCGVGNKPYFRPNANVTRGQTSKIVAIAVGAPDPPLGQRDFEDVPTTHTFWQWIEALYIGSVISGYPCGGPGEPCGGEQLAYFRPNNNVTRGQSSKIITNTFFPRCEAQIRPGK